MRAAQGGRELRPAYVRVGIKERHESSPEIRRSGAKGREPLPWTEALRGLCLFIPLWQLQNEICQAMGAGLGLSSYRQCFWEGSCFYFLDSLALGKFFTYFFFQCNFSGTALFGEKNLRTPQLKSTIEILLLLKSRSIFKHMFIPKTMATQQKKKKKKVHIQ